MYSSRRPMRKIRRGDNEPLLRHLSQHLFFAHSALCWTMTTVWALSCTPLHLLQPTVLYWPGLFGSEPALVTFKGAKESIPGPAGQYDNPFCRTGPSALIGWRNRFLGTINVYISGCSGPNCTVWKYLCHPFKISSCSDQSINYEEINSKPTSTGICQNGKMFSTFVFS